LVYIIKQSGPALTPGAGDPGPDGLDSLLEAAGRGDYGAFDLVFEQLSAPVYSVIRAVLRDPAQAQEVAQEVFLEIWQVASRYDATAGGATAWVLTIARRRAIDRVRSAAAAAGRDQRTAAIPFPDQVSDIVEEILEREQLRRCLGSLSKMHREAIMLAFYDGYTYLQVAGILDIPLGTAKTRIRDGLIKLRDRMQDGTAAAPGLRASRPEARRGIGHRSAAPRLIKAAGHHVRPAGSPRPARFAPPDTADELTQVMQWALLHLDQPLTVDALATRASMSPRAFARRFRQRTGTTPGLWVNRQRVLRAARLLERGNDTIAAVSVRSGFGSPDTLRRHFIQARGATPSQYRRAFRLT
jgi:RNA polymerase sigma-70 factor, ECF subfamily